MEDRNLLACQIDQFERTCLPFVVFQSEPPNLEIWPRLGDHLRQNWHFWNFRPPHTNGARSRQPSNRLQQTATRSTPNGTSYKTCNYQLCNWMSHILPRLWTSWTRLSETGKFTLNPFQQLSTAWEHPVLYIFWKPILLRLEWVPIDQIQWHTFPQICHWSWGTGKLHKTVFPAYCVKWPSLVLKITF